MGSEGLRVVRSMVSFWIGEARKQSARVAECDLASQRIVEAVETRKRLNRILQDLLRIARERIVRAEQNARGIRDLEQRTKRQRRGQRRDVVV